MQNLINLLLHFRLTSAVAEHRRSVRPSRRTQGSRNPLRVLAAREDIRQDLMGNFENVEESSRLQAEKSMWRFILCFCIFFFFKSNLIILALQDGT